jgi:hypothetical protein
MVATAPVQSPSRPADGYPDGDHGRSDMNDADVPEPIQSTVHAEPERFTIAQAATLLGTSRDAIRQRIRRGTLRSEKADGKWYIYLAEESAAAETSGTDGLDNVPSDHPSIVQSTRPNDDLYRQLVDQLRGEVAFLREELRRKDQLLAGFAQRIPMLEAPQQGGESGAREARSVQADPPHEVPETPSAASAAPAESHRPWWKFWAHR